MLKESKNGNLEYHKLPKEEMERRGILGRLIGVCADFINPTRNGRLYPESLWEKVFDSDIMKEKIANKVCYGELGHPADREETDMEKVAVCLAEQPTKGSDGKLRAVFDILNTKNGQILKTLCDYGSTLGISSRGSGDLITDYDGNESVDPDTYNCEGFDIVLVPAIKEARLQYVTEALNAKKYNKTLKQKLVEELNKASESDKKIMQESLDTLGIKLNESTLVTKGDSLQGEEEYQIIDQGYDSLSEKKLYKIIGNDGKERWIPESDAKFVIDKGFEPVPEVEEEPVEMIQPEAPVEESVDIKESSLQELENDFNDWKRANPDVDLQALVDDYKGNLGGILYSEDGYDKFVKWAKDTHGVTINGLDDEADEFDQMLNEPPVESDEVETSEEQTEETTEDLNEEGVQLADVNVGAAQDAIDLNKKKKLNEDEDGASFYVSDNGVGETEIIYKGYVITYDNDGQVIVNIDGDETHEESLESAVATIDELDEDPDYHVEPWRKEEDTKVASLDGVKTMLGLNEEMYVKKKGSYKKVAEDKEEKAEPIDESFLTALENKELDEGYNDLMGRGYTNAIQAINDGIETDEDEEALQHYLQEIIGYCRSIADDYGLLLESKDESLSDTEVDNVESNEAVASLKEALKKAKKLEKDNLSLQEKLSASNARETQLEEEVSRYKKATVSLSKSAKEAKSLKEDLNKIDKKSKELTEKLDSATSKAKDTFKELSRAGEENKKLTEQVGKLTTKNEEIVKQLTESKELVEKYRKSYRSLKEAYVESKAQYYGVSKDAALQRLGESYKVSDVDKSLRELGVAKKDMSKLPIELNENAKIKKNNLKVKTNEKIDSLDDTSLDILKSLLD